MGAGVDEEAEVDEGEGELEGAVGFRVGDEWHFGIEGRGVWGVVGWM